MKHKKQKAVKKLLFWGAENLAIYIWSVGLKVKQELQQVLKLPIEIF